MSFKYYSKIFLFVLLPILYGIMILITGINLIMGKMNIVNVLSTFLAFTGVIVFMFPICYFALKFITFMEDKIKE